MNLDDLGSLYRQTLLDEVVPFWERFGVDSTGAFNSCVDDHGALISRDRWAWSQWRAVWVFSKLHNAIEPRPHWLQIARGICDWLRRYGPLKDGHWPFLLDADGAVKRGWDCFFTDTFAIYGLVELWRATRQDELLELAVATYRAAESALSKPSLPPMAVYPPPPHPRARAHGLSMMCSLVYDELATATGVNSIRAAADRHHRLVMNTFLRRDRGLLLEWAGPDGEELPPTGGTAVVPGHAIESLWFQIHIARAAGDRSTIERAIAAIRSHLEIGWDEEFGGVLYAVDADGRSEVGWPYADMKLWWVHTEVLYATLLAYELSGEAWCMEWHERIREYAFSHYPVPPFGEWTQRLDRQGRPISTVVALPVKDPFHLPRALIYCVQSLDRLLCNPATA